MIEQVLTGAVRHRWLVLFITLVIAVIGGWQLNLLPIDVTPDITNKQVQINTVIPTLSPVRSRSALPTRSRPRWQDFGASRTPGRSRATASARSR